MVSAPHNVMESEWRHIIHQRFVRFKHYAQECAHRSRLLRERHMDPFLRNRLRRELGVPGQTAEGIPVGLSEVMSGPVARRAGVGYTGHAGQALIVKTTVHHFGYG